jgi:hypothetical protein
MTVVFRRGLAVLCMTSAAAAGGYLIAAQTPAGAQSPAAASSGSSSTAMTCIIQKSDGRDSAASDVKRRAVEQLANDLGVSVDRLGQATVVLKQQGVEPKDPRAAEIIAQRLGLDVAVVRTALDRMLATFPFNQASGTRAKVARPAAQVPVKSGDQVPVKSGDTAGCRTQSVPSDGNDPKTVALRGLAHELGVTKQQLDDAFGKTESHGVRTLDDPRMPAALAQSLGLDAARVQQAIAGMLSHPPFDRATGSAAVARAQK